MTEFLINTALCVAILFLFFVGIGLERALHNLAALLHAKTQLARDETEKVQRELCQQNKVAEVPYGWPFCSPHPSFPAF